MAPHAATCLDAAVVLKARELLAAHDALREHVLARARLGTVVERIGPLILTHYGTHCTVEHPALDVEASASLAQFAAQVQTQAIERGEPVDWSVFAHDAAAPQLTAALEAAGFIAGWERGVLVGEVAELEFPQPAPGWKVASVRWDESDAQRALDLSALSSPHRVPLADCHALRSTPYWDLDVRILAHHGTVTAACWLNNIRGTPFTALDGLTAPCPELLAQLPLWRFQPPAKQFLVADADGARRSMLLAGGFREVTTARSHHWAPPDGPAATPPARQSLNDAVNGRIARRCETRVGFDYGVGTVYATTWSYVAVDMRVCHARRMVAGGW